MRSEDKGVSPPNNRMIENYGFKDGSGAWFVVIDTDKCNGCGKCLNVCPASALELGPDEFDISRETPVVSVKPGQRKEVRYSCAPCRPGYGTGPPPCVAACETGAVSHSEGWKILYGR